MQFICVHIHIYIYIYIYRRSAGTQTHNQLPRTSDPRSLLHLSIRPSPRLYPSTRLPEGPLSAYLSRMQHYIRT